MRLRTPKAKPGELLVKYGKEFGDEDLFFCFGGSGATSRDSKLLMIAFERPMQHGVTLRQELINRGYDITTLKFTIQKVKP